MLRHGAFSWLMKCVQYTAARRAVKNAEFPFDRARCAIFLTGPHGRPYAGDIGRYRMKKASKVSKSPAKSAKRKVAIKDLKAKDAGSVKGGYTSIPAFPRSSSDKDIKISTINTSIKWE